MVMKINKSITLDTLIYWPTPTISGVEDKDQICYSVWKQVFGNAYVMESERDECYVVESSYRAGDIPLREFVRGLALSETYKRRFFECCGPYRSIELNFKHILGRGPNSQQEFSKHLQVMVNEGYAAQINLLIDSLEYDELFGNDYVPYMQFKGTYATCEEFNRMCTLYSSPGTTDKSLTMKARSSGIDNPNTVLSLDGAGVTSRLVGTITNNTPSSYVNVKKAIPSRPDLDLGVSTIGADAQDVINPKAAPKVRYQVVPGSYMFLTKQEIAEYEATSLHASKITALAQDEISDAQRQIELLQQKIAELSMVQ